MKNQDVDIKVNTFYGPESMDKPCITIVSWKVEGDRMDVQEKEIMGVIGSVSSTLNLVNPLYSVCLPFDSKEEVIFLFNDEIVACFKDKFGEEEYDDVMHSYFECLWEKYCRK